MYTAESLAAGVGDDAPSRRTMQSHQCFDDFDMGAFCFCARFVVVAFSFS
jgi:hypothetical protein